MARLVGGAEPVQKKKSPIKEVIRTQPLLQLTYGDLLSNTPPNIRDNARNPKCGRRFLGAVKKPNGLVTLVWKAGCSGREHMTTMEIMPSRISPMNVPLRTQCSCEYYVYNLEVVMASSGLSENRYALPQWPVIRNPEGSKHFCKHGILVGPDFRNQAKNLFKNPDDIDTMPPSQLVKKMDQSFVKTRKPAKKRR